MLQCQPDLKALWMFVSMPFSFQTSGARLTSAISLLGSAKTSSGDLLFKWAHFIQFEVAARCLPLYLYFYTNASLTSKISRDHYQRAGLE